MTVYKKTYVFLGIAAILVAGGIAILFRMLYPPIDWETIAIVSGFIAFLGLMNLSKGISGKYFRFRPANEAEMGQAIMGEWKPKKNYQDKIKI